MKKLLFVMNPYAGTRRASKVLAEILEVFSGADHDAHVYITRGPGDGKRLVMERAGEMDLVVCCGGDGTFNEAVAGILESGAQTPLGYIPAGSTNDFATSLGIPLNPIKAAKAIVEGSAESYDVCCFGGRYFTYVASFGAFTKTSYKTPQNVKNALGHTAYLLGGIQEISQIRSVPVELEIDGETVKDNFLFGAVCNSTSLGGVLTLDPKQVDMRDGRFEILLVRAPKDLTEIAECIQAVQKQKYNCNMITFRSAGKITVRTDPEMPWTLDGEMEPGHREVTIENLHHAIRLVK